MLDKKKLRVSKESDNPWSSPERRETSVPTWATGSWTSWTASRHQGLLTPWLRSPFERLSTLHLNEKQLSRSNGSTVWPLPAETPWQRYNAWWNQAWRSHSTKPAWFLWCQRHQSDVPGNGRQRAEANLQLNARKVPTVRKEVRHMGHFISPGRAIIEPKSWRLNSVGCHRGQSWESSLLDLCTFHKVSSLVLRIYEVRYMDSWKRRRLNNGSQKRTQTQKKAPIYWTSRNE
jgi:hypothetical protein